MTLWNTLPNAATVQKTIDALRQNGITAFFVEDEEAARKKVLELIPEKSEVMEMTSVTLDAVGMAKALRDAQKYTLVRDTLTSMDRKTQGREMQKLGAAPEVALGSVHAITHDGKVIIASNSGSQLPAYSYGADKVIWVVGAQKIVQDLGTAHTRLYEYTLPLESERAKKAYGVPGSFVSKLLIVHREIQENRLFMVIINKVLGF